MQKIVINTTFGGFGLSVPAIKRYLELKGLPCHFFRNSFCDLFSGSPKYEEITPEEANEEFTPLAHSSPEPTDESYFDERAVPRDCPTLVQVVEEMGKEAAANYATLKVVEIPDDVAWHIYDYDGAETVCENHRSWS